MSRRGRLPCGPEPGDGTVARGAPWRSMDDVGSRFSGSRLLRPAAARVAGRLLGSFSVSPGSFRVSSSRFSFPLQPKNYRQGNSTPW